MSVSSIDFLRKNNLNFGDWINNGITLTDKKGELYARKRFNLDGPDMDQPPRKLISLTNQTDIDKMGAIFAKLDEFLLSSETIFPFDPVNGFLRRYIYEQVESKYADSLVLKKNENSVLCGHKIDKESKVEFDRKQAEENIVKFHDMIGFKQVFNALVESKKPIVGHNLLYDLMFIHRWLDSELPQDFGDFKNKLNANFKHVFDTKYVDSSGVLGVKLEDTTLAQCMARYKIAADVTSSGSGEDKMEIAVATPQTCRVDVVISSDCVFDPEETCFHNAGYDAYCTGFVFAQQLEEYASIQAKASGGGISATAVFDSFHQVCSNKTFMMLSLFHMNLDGGNATDVIKHEGSVFRVSDFPRRVQTQDVLRVCTAAVTSQGIDVTVTAVDTTIVWVDDVSFFVVVNESRLSEEALREAMMESFRSEGWRGQTYAEFVTSLTAPVGVTKDEEEKKEEEEDSAPPAAAAPRMKRDSSLSTWMSTMFSFVRSSDKDQMDEQAAKKRPRVEK